MHINFQYQTEGCLTPASIATLILSLFWMKAI